jgi:type IV secretory pathway VirB2 component (pilin)
VLTAVAIATLVAVVGIVVTSVALARHKRAWPFAVGTFVLCLAALFFGGAAYSVAVGG